MTTTLRRGKVGDLPGAKKRKIEEEGSWKRRSFAKLRPSS